MFHLLLMLCLLLLTFFAFGWITFGFRQIAKRIRRCIVRSNFGLEVLDGLLQPAGQRDFRFPLEDFPGAGDVRPALFRVILRQRFENNFAA